MANLTAELITRLREDDSPDVRRETVAVLTAEFNQPDLQPGEQRLAEAIFRIMVRDADVGVRRALAEGLKNNPAVPPELAMILARDVAEVAVPMLHYSLVFTEQELIEIARSQPEAWQQAVARRALVTAPVADVLVETGSENVVITLVQNQGAVITETASNKVIDRFPESEAVMSGLIQRPIFPPRLAERLIAAVSEALRQKLAALPGLDPEFSGHLVAGSQHAMTLGIDILDNRQENLTQLVRQMDIKGRLTTALIMRALCAGYLDFFEMAAVRRAGIDPVNVHALMASGSNKGAEALCKAAKLPHVIVGVVAIAGRIRAGMAALDSTEERALYQQELVAACQRIYPDLPAGNMEALITKLNPAVAKRK